MRSRSAATASALPEPTLPRPPVTGHALISERDWAAIGRSLRLSGREIQMIGGVFDGATEAAIAQDLGISAHTVHTYLVRLYRKLEVNSRCELLIRVFAEHLEVNLGRRE